MSLSLNRILRNRVKNALSWEVGHADAEDAEPARFVPAQVPGAVQLDYARANHYPDWTVGDRVKYFAPFEDNWHVYRTRFAAPALKAGETLQFTALGVDYACDIFFNGAHVCAHEGMFSPIKVDLTPLLRPQNELRVRVRPAPKNPNARPEIPREQASACVKPAVSYGWDFHPRLIPLGIWDECFLEILPQRRLDDVYFDYALTDDFSRADIRVRVEGVGLKGLIAEWWLRDDGGNAVATQRCPLQGDTVTLPAVALNQPKLWWTHDQGEPYLYSARLHLLDADGARVADAEQSVGFRRVRLVMNAGGWDEPADFPKSRSVSPSQWELNGRQIFIKGSNVVPPDVFPGRLDDARYDTLLSLAKSAHLNALRMWGGGLVNKEGFFDLADEKGILVWQEFPLACNCYPDDDAYLSTLKQEATALVRRLRKHPCLGLFCGGNELYNGWSRMSEQSLALRLLSAVTLELSPQIPFIATSPLFGMAHGHYVFRDPESGAEPFQVFGEARDSAYCEFGVPGAAPLAALEAMIPEAERFPIADTPAWVAHHALHAWKPARDEWLCVKAIEFYFGASPDLKTLVERSQFLQAQGYKAIFEEARRQKPYCAAALNWCFNEPWPCAANNSLLAYPAEPKPAYAAVAESCRPVCASARVKKFVWSEGETFDAELFVLNDVFAPQEGGVLTATLTAAGDTLALLEWRYAATEPNVNAVGPVARAVLPHWNCERFTLTLTDRTHPERSSAYTFLYRVKDAPKRADGALN